MTMFVLSLAQQTITLLGIVILGVSGQLTSFDGTYAQWDRHMGITLPPYVILSVNDYEDHRLHETGHLKQAKILGSMYYPLIAVPSFINSIRVVRGIIDYRHRHDTWSETWANELTGAYGSPVIPWTGGTLP